MPTRRDVAKLANVSEGVVSYVINNNTDKVRPETRARVLEAIRQLNYRPNWAARALRSQSTRQVAILARDIVNPFYSTLASVLEEELGNRGYGLVLYICRTHSRKSVESVLSRRVDGVISVSVPIDPDQAEALRDQNLPVVAITRGHEEQVLIDIDWAAAMEEVTEHLVLLGHRKIGFLSGHPLDSPDNERYHGLCEAASARGLEVRLEHTAVSDYTFQGGYESARALLEHGDRPTALVCGNDLMAAGALAACRERGVHVPKDISLVGVDDILMSQLLSPALTTVSYPLEEAGRQAVSLLLDQLESDEPTSGRVVRLPHRFIVRESTGKAPTNVQSRG